MYFDYYEHMGVIFKIVCDEEYLLQIKSVEEKTSPSKNELTEKVKTQLDEYFRGKRREFELPLSFKGTSFQKKVWEQLLKIPYGQTCSYLDIAKMIGNPKACRAVGGANNKNPIWIVIPCHRVIGANGALTGYGGGVELKKRLLEIEKIGKD